MVNDWSQLSASAALMRLQRGELTVRQLADACLARIAARDAEVMAWAWLDPEQVRREAARLDGLSKRGPLHGIPIGIKDVFLTKDMPTQYNSPLYRDHRPHIDAACVTLLRQAGALIMGKTHTVEFGATGQPPPTRNPHHLEHTPGGSSSGSAAAVADFHVPLALATQTGGSTIRPASFCGVYAMKPTWGRFVHEGAKVFAPSLDTLGFMSRSADDLALLFAALSGDATLPSFELSGARVALCRSPAWRDASQPTQDALHHTARVLAQHGARLSELNLPLVFNDLNAMQQHIMVWEGGRSFVPEYRQDAAALHPNLRAQVENTAGLSHADWLEALDCAARCRQQFDALAATYDVIVTPSASGSAPAGLASTGHWTFNAMWTLLHVPCINVPGFLDAQGLPVGITLTGPRASDQRLLAAAKVIGPLLSMI